MDKLNVQSNINQLIDLKTSFSNDFTKQKNLVLDLLRITNIISSGIKDLIPLLENIDNILPYFIQELGIPFSDIINESNIIKYYFNIYISNKTEVSKNILISFIQVFNFVSDKKTPGDMLLQLLLCYDSSFKQLSDNKRKTRTEVEQIYNSINSIDINCSLEEKMKIKNELLEQVNQIEKKNSFSIAEIQYLKEKIETIDKNLKIIDLNNIKCGNIFNDINHLIKNFEIFKTFQNLNDANNNSDNNSKINDEMKKMKAIPLKEREFLYLNEQLNEEADNIEFKNYSYPFSKEKIEELKRQYCGFLNSQGGLIFIGINDIKLVNGIYLDYKARDTIKNELVNYYVYDFYPKCRIDKISIYFIPIKHPQTNAPIHNLFVIKINILPGEPYNLYSLNNKGGYISTLRLHRQCINLTAQEIYSEIMKRSELLKQKYIQSQNKKVESKQTDNNEEMKEENEDASHISDEGINEPQSDDTKVKKKVVYVVKITNIDTSLKIKDLNRYFNGCGASLQKFPAIEGNSQGFGEIHFPKRESAKLIIKKFNRMSLCGSKQINMRLTKTVVVNEN
jgi:hypothetical protein